MRTKKVTRYFCDFCSKGMLRSDAMTHHESRCTANPHRHCGMCATERDYPKLVAEFLQSYDNITKRESLYFLKSSVPCPVCIFTVLRQSNVAGEFGDLFQLKDEMQSYNTRCEEAM